MSTSGNHSISVPFQVCFRFISASCDRLMRSSRSWDSATSAWIWAGVRVHSGQEVKVVWRMTGAGELQLGAVGPAGRRISPDWIQAHEGSNWQRPGQEWGSGFTFPVAGCWDLHATRGASSGDVWLV